MSSSCREAGATHRFIRDLEPSSFEVCWTCILCLGAEISTCNTNVEVKYLLPTFPLVDGNGVGDFLWIFGLAGEGGDSHVVRGDRDQARERLAGSFKPEAALEVSSHCCVVRPLNEPQDGDPVTLEAGAVGAVEPDPPAQPPHPPGADAQGTPGRRGSVLGAAEDLEDLHDVVEPVVAVLVDDEAERAHGGQHGQQQLGVFLHDGGVGVGGDGGGAPLPSSPHSASSLC